MKRKIIMLLFILMGVESFGQAPSWAWAKSAGGSLEDDACSIATDKIGNVYITGSFYSPSINFGSIILTNSDNTGATSDIYIAKYDANGTLIWVNRYGGTGNDYSWSIVTDKLNNIYITGNFQSPTIGFGATTLNNSSFFNMFVIKCDSSGTVMWANSSGGTATARGNSVAIDTSNNVYVTGYFLSGAIILGVTTLSNSGSMDMFIAKYNTWGTVIWANRAGGTQEDNAESVTTDISGDVFVTGYFDSPTIIFGSDTLINSVGGSTDMFIVKYNSAGVVIWAKSPGGNSDNIGEYVKTDNLGNVLVAGSLFDNGTGLIFGTTTLVSIWGYDIFIVKYNSSGTVLWAESFGGNGQDEVYSLAVDVSDNFYLTGAFLSSSLGFGSTTLTNSSGAANMFIAKCDTLGLPVWAKSVGGTNAVYGNGLAVDEFSNIYVTGSYRAPTVAFNSYVLTNTGNYDIFTAKLNTTTGIAEYKFDDGLIIYPNPFTSQTTISFSEEHTSAGSAPHTIKVINVLGEVIQQLTTNNKQLTLDMAGVAKGIYFVEITGGSAGSAGSPTRPTDVVNRKIVVQ